MNDQRYVRFSSLGEIQRDDVRLAADIWLDDALKAPWATKDSMKLAGVLYRYMMAPSAERLNLKSMEDLYQLSADAARRALVQFSLYGLIEAYSTDGNELRAALRLSRLQMLRVLQTKHQLHGLEQEGGLSGMPLATKTWAPADGEPELSESAMAEPALPEPPLLNPAYVRDQPPEAYSDEAAATAPFAVPAPAPVAAVPVDSVPVDTVPTAANPANIIPAETASGEIDPHQRDADVAPAALAAPAPSPRPPAEVHGSTQAVAALVARATSPPRRERAGASTGEPLSGQDALALSLRRLQQRVPR